MSIKTTYTCTWSSPTAVAGVGCLDPCGAQTDCAVQPSYKCPQGHDASWWRSDVTLWTCVHESCDSTYATLRNAHPRTSCSEGHLQSSWRRAPGALAEALAATDVAPSPSASQVTLTPPATRQRLPTERVAKTVTFRLRYTHKDGTPDEMHLYVTSGEYSDGRLGEVFIKADRMGTLARGALDATATMMSMLLQYGVPIATVLAKLRHTRYEPSGFTGDPEFPSCSSALDLVAQWLERRYGDKDVAS